ncbi:MAG: SMP-30/gluconolactonase/LRE family protein [Lachnospiraceae bacterium]|jgi:sugar lactone lactonase YvrE|nr:SMP-30/gluconolactonase/LRE family protein [Lachnospiraceae bacterium]
MKEYTAIVMDAEKHSLGESPYYDPRYDRYSWVDITQGRLWTMTEGRKTYFELGQPIGAAIPLRDTDGFLLAARDGLYVYRDGKADCIKGLQEVYKPYWRSNDAKADRSGRIWFGATVSDEHEPEGSLFCYDKGEILCMQENTKIANGMAWSKDQKHFFFSDSLEYAVFRYTYDAKNGTITDRQVLFTVEDGVPDGMCIDAEDNLWVAIWGGSRIEKRSSVTGELLAVVHVPAEHTSSCCLAKKAGSVFLFITSAGDGLTGEYDGCLFRCPVEVPGVISDFAKV